MKRADGQTDTTSRAFWDIEKEFKIVNEKFYRIF